MNGIGFFEYILPILYILSIASPEKAVTPRPQKKLRSDALRRFPFIIPQQRNPP